MPVNKSAMVRYRIIDGCLRNRMHRYPSIEYIQEKINDAGYDVSVSMLRKDLQAMKRELHAPIEHDRERGGYYYSDEHFSIQGIPLTADEIAALDYSTALLQQIKGSKMFQQFENAINKLIEGYRISKITGEETTRFLQIEEPLRQTDSQWLEPILQAVVNKTVLRFFPLFFWHHTNSWRRTGESRFIFYSISGTIHIKPAVASFTKSAKDQSKANTGRVFGLLITRTHDDYSFLWGECKSCGATEIKRSYC